MKNDKIDGFIRRRPTGSGVSGAGGLQPRFEQSGLSNTTEDRRIKQSSLRPENESGLERSEIDASLKSIDDEQVDSNLRKRKKPKGPRRKQIAKRAIIIFIVIVLGIGAYVAIKTYIASGRIFQGNIFGLIQSKPLKEDANGRSNILVFGTSEDDKEGGLDHPGQLLTDSMMVVSIDQKQKNAYTFSVPRDLLVEYGRTCLEGDSGRINSYYQCVASDKAQSPEGAKALKKLIGGIFGLDIQYYAHINYSVVKDSVDAVGGIDVDIQGDGPVPYGVKPGSILDRNFDWKCNYQCYYVKYEPGVHHLDGAHALALARARGASGGYGLPKSNFNREINQQKIAAALVKKASAVGTITDLGKVTSLIDAMGDNLRTNFDTSEIRTLMDLGSELAQNNQMKSISLVDAEPPIFVVQNTVSPVLGLFDYSGLQAFIRKKLSSDPIVREDAKVGVYNGNGKPGAAKEAADKLEELNISVADIGDAPAAKYPPHTLYVLNDKLTATKSKLEDLYSIQASSDKPPFTTTGLDFVIIIGKPAEPS